MPQTINVLFLAAEAEPFVKVGGLGDVAGTLPRALRALSNDEIKLDVRIPPHSTKTLTLPALRAGMYQFYCDVCCGGKENPSMQGLLKIKA